MVYKLIYKIGKLVLHNKLENKTNFRKGMHLIKHTIIWLQYENLKLASVYKQWYSAGGIDSQLE